MRELKLGRVNHIGKNCRSHKAPVREPFLHKRQIPLLKFDRSQERHILE
jgi:hypothetical protein